MKRDLFKHKAQAGGTSAPKASLIFNLMERTGPTSGQIANNGALTAAFGTFSYSSNGQLTSYCRNSSNLLVGISSSFPRVEPEGVLVEPATTNNVLQSNTFSNAAWTKTSVTVSQNAQSPKAGTDTDAWTITAFAATAAHGLKQTVTKNSFFIYPINGPVGYSIFVKNSATMPWVTLADDSFANWFTFNAATGALGSRSGANVWPMVRAYGNGFYLLGVGLPGNAGATFDWNCYFSKNQTDATPVAGAMPTWLGAGETAVVWQAQGEFQFAGDGLVTSPIPTTTDAAQRGSDFFSALPSPDTGNVSVRILQRHCWDVPGQKLSTIQLLTPLFSSANTWKISTSGSNPETAAYNGAATLTTKGINFQPITSGNIGPGFHASAGTVDVVSGNCSFASDAATFWGTGGSAGFSDRSGWTASVGISFTSGAPFWVRNVEIYEGETKIWGDISSNADLGTGVKIACVGDNNTAGTSVAKAWADTLQLSSAFPIPRAVYKMGAESFQSTGLAQTFTDFIAGKGYNTVILWTGEVDLLFSRSAAATFAAWSPFALNCIAAGIHVVALNFCPWESHAGWPVGATAEVATLNADIASFCAARPSDTTFIDIRTVIEDPGTPNQLNPSYSDDGDNLNNAGHAAVAAAVKSALGW